MSKQQTSRLMTVIAAALLASACAMQAPIDSAPPAPEVVRYQCAEQVGMSVTYARRATGEGTALLTWDGKDFPLRQEVSGSGARYTDGTLTLVTKGDEAFVEKAGEIVLKDCNAKA